MLLPLKDLWVDINHSFHPGDRSVFGPLQTHLEISLSQIHNAKKDEPIVNSISIIIIRIKNFTLKYTEIFWMYYVLTLVLQAEF